MPLWATSRALPTLTARGDGRYILSNAKDQTMKLWDLRMAMSTDRCNELDASGPTRTRPYDYDYRWENYDMDEWFPHEHDNSVVTFRGHKVQRTLIRCHFSPGQHQLTLCLLRLTRRLRLRMEP